MRKEAVLLVYGEGGHRAQMKRLYAQLKPELKARGFEAVGVCEYEDSIDEFENYSLPALRDKYSWGKSFVMAPVAIFKYLSAIIRIAGRHKIVGVISTGPGLAIVPSLIFKLLGARIVFVETWSRFETSSLTGRVMYRVADRFYYQNKSLDKHYPQGRYGGLL